MKVLFIGDVVGKGGRRAVVRLLPHLRREFTCAFCIANGENAAGGAGLTTRCARELLNAGVDVITTGDHVWDQKTFVNEIPALPAVLRPANVAVEQPGQGCRIYTIPAGGQVAVLQLLGRVFMSTPSDCPFAAADRLLAELQGKTTAVFVDFHAEATSEKVAMGRHLDGRVTCVCGTHTHVPTADERVLPGGTAYISDVGMVGSGTSILGRAIKPVLRRFTTGLPARFTVVDDDIVLHAVVIEFDPATGRATGIQRVQRREPA